jgi:hypothetical protein
MTDTFYDGEGCDVDFMAVAGWVFARIVQPNTLVISVNGTEGARIDVDGRGSHLLRLPLVVRVLVAAFDADRGEVTVLSVAGPSLDLNAVPCLDGLWTVGEAAFRRLRRFGSSERLRAPTLRGLLRRVGWIDVDSWRCSLGWLDLHR